MKPFRDVSEIFDEAAEAESQSFLHLVNQVDQTLSAEKAHCRNLHIVGRLVKIPPLGKATVVGDLHGDIGSLRHILTESKFVEEASIGREVYLVFLGDYGDRGHYSPEVYYVVLSLKNMFSEKVILIQGNHEGPEDLLAYPHDLPYQLQRKFGSKWHSVYEELSRLFRNFYTAALVDGRYIMFHGGVPSGAKTLDDIAYAFEKHPAESHLEEILWSDPAEGIKGTYPSLRGAGNFFGEDVTTNFLERLNIRFIIRGHEPTDEGYKINHNGKVLTLFSRKGSPYFNSQGAYLSIDLSKVYGSAKELEPFIRKF